MKLSIIVYDNNGAKIVKIMQSTFNKSKITFPLFSLNRKIVSFFWGGYSCQIGVFVVALLFVCRNDEKIRNRFYKWIIFYNFAGSKQKSISQ